MNFSEVNIDSSIIHDLTVVPLKKVVLTLLQTLQEARRKER